MRHQANYDSAKRQKLRQQNYVSKCKPKVGRWYVTTGKVEDVVEVDLPEHDVGRSTVVCDYCKDKLWPGDHFPF